MTSTPQDGMFYVSDAELNSRVTRYTEFVGVKHNIRVPDLHVMEWSGTKDCQIIARWIKRDAVVLNTITDRRTITPYTHNEIGGRSIQHMEECGGIEDTHRGGNYIYLTYDGIHYNALRLNDNQTLLDNDTAKMRSGNKEKRKREGDPPEAANTAHTVNTQATTNDARKIEDINEH